MDCQLLEGRLGGHSTHLLVVGCGNENISWGLLPRKAAGAGGGGPGQSCWLAPTVLGRGWQGRALVPQQLFSWGPCLPLSTHKGDKPLPNDTLPGKSHFIPTHGPLIRSFGQCYHSIEPFPGLRQGWTYREREEQVEVIAVNRRDKNRRVTPYNLISPQEAAERNERHPGGAVNVLLPRPFQTPSLSSVGWESWAGGCSTPAPRPRDG